MARGPSTSLILWLVGMGCGPMVLLSPQPEECALRGPGRALGAPAVLLGALCLHYVLVPSSPPLTPTPLGKLPGRPARQSLGLNISVSLWS